MLTARLAYRAVVDVHAAPGPGEPVVLVEVTARVLTTDGPPWEEDFFEAAIFSEDEQEWSRLADAALTAHGWERTSDWDMRPDEAAADVVPAGERMSPAELRLARERLGLTLEWLARRLDVHDRTVRKWETGISPVPDGARLDVEVLLAQATAAVQSTVAELTDHEVAGTGPGQFPPVPVLMTYRSDGDYAEHDPSEEWPCAGWHRAVTARVLERTDARAVYYDPTTKETIR